MSKVSLGKFFSGLFKKGKINGNVLAKTADTKGAQKLVTESSGFKKAAEAIKSQGKAAIETAKNTSVTEPAKQLSKSEAVKEYEAIRKMYQAEGAPMPAILNNKMTVAERLEFLRDNYWSRIDRKADLADAFAKRPRVS